MDPLDEVISRETVREIVALLTPVELMVLILRADGMDDLEIAEFLAMDRKVVHQRVMRAKRRIVRSLPEVADSVRGRKKPWTMPV